MSKITKKVQFGEHTLVLETGEIARQADGAVFANIDGTQVLVTVVGKKEGAEDNDFFPLTVEYKEMTYAAGRIPGGFKKREGPPSEHAALTCRLIDRPLRPLFPEHFYNEVQIVATVMSLNPDVSPDMVAMIGASAALAISGIPFAGPIGGMRVGYRDGMYLANPSTTALKDSALDLVVAGTKDAVLMVESEAKELSEEVMLGAVMYGHEMMQWVIQAIEELAEEAGKPRWDWQPPQVDRELVAKVEAASKDKLSAAYSVSDKQQRYQQLNEVRHEVSQTLTQDDETLNADNLGSIIGGLEKNIVRGRILAGEPRIDGRDRVTVRPISIRTGLLDRVHGSVLFTRGETQAIVTATLGNDRDAQLLDNLEGEAKDRFMLHYNFPPYSVGETGRLGNPKRREIGHGRLARRAVSAVLPNEADFPYVIRIVSDITESNGSSSMASVCGASLSMMDAGVPIKAPVAGVAMGLIKEGDDYAVLTDILGDEDHLGDMDFKVAGTESGVTALQMDIKISGITKDIMEQALAQARDGRMHILGVMNNALAEHREELSQHAPRIVTMKVAEDKVRTIIGKGGATIKSLIDTTGVSINIEDDGTVQLFSPNNESLAAAQQQIKDLTGEVEVGKNYRGKVTKIVEFGAFINLIPNKDGLLHISKICEDRSGKVEDVLSEGQEIEVHVSGLDRQGRVQLQWVDKPATQAAATTAEETTQDPESTPEDK